MASIDFPGSEKRCVLGGNWGVGGMRANIEVAGNKQIFSLIIDVPL